MRVTRDCAEDRATCSKSAESSRQIRFPEWRASQSDGPCRGPAPKECAESAGLADGTPHNLHGRASAWVVATATLGANNANGGSKSWLSRCRGDPGDHADARGRSRPQLRAGVPRTGQPIVSVYGAWQQLYACYQLMVHDLVPRWITVAVS